MTDTRTFANSFWGGFNAIVRQAERSNERLESLCLWLELRVAAQESTIKKLMKLYHGSKKSYLEKLHDCEVYSTNSSVWKQFLAQGIKEIEFHREASDKLNIVLNETKEFLKEIRKTKKQLSFDGQRLLDLWASKEQAVKKAKERFHDATLKLNGLVDAKNTILQQNRTNVTQEIAKINISVAKQEKTTQKAESDYRHLLSEIQEYHPNWVQQLEGVMQEFQKAELSSLDFQKEKLSSYVTIFSLEVDVKKRQFREQKKAIGSVDNDNDLSQWISMSQTGSEPPQPPQFIPPSGISVSSTDTVSKDTSTNSLDLAGSTLMPLKKKPSFASFTLRSRRKSHLRESSEIPKTESPNLLKVSEPPQSKNILLPPKTPNEQEEKVLVRALHDFIGDVCDELDFLEGNIFVLLAKPSGDWWVGKNYGRIGWFPKNYVCFN